MPIAARPLLVALVLATGFPLASALAAPSAPKRDAEPSPRHVVFYNRAYDALRDLRFEDAQSLLEQSLAEREDFAPAHNNLAYALRKRGEGHYDDAMRHYDRAIELDPELAEAYMYRGVLHVLRGDTASAEADHQTLRDLKERRLAKQLAWVIEHGREKEPERFFGVVGRQ